jgi:hypothetical protein
MLRILLTAEPELPVPPKLYGVSKGSGLARRNTSLVGNNKRQCCRRASKLHGPNNLWRLTEANSSYEDYRFTPSFEVLATS